MNNPKRFDRIRRVLRSNHWDLVACSLPMNVSRCLVIGPWSASYIFTGMDASALRHGQGDELWNGVADPTSIRHWRLVLDEPKQGWPLAV